MIQKSYRGTLHGALDQWKTFTVKIAEIQKKAEIMAGRIAINENNTEQPRKLKQVVLGEATAIEINWKPQN